MVGHLLYLQVHFCLSSHNNDYRHLYRYKILFYLSLFCLLQLAFVSRHKSFYFDPDFITEVRWSIDSVQWVEDPLLMPDLDSNHFSSARAQQIIAKYGDSILYYDPALCRRWYYVRLDIPAGGTVELTVRYSIENHMSTCKSFGKDVTDKNG